MICLRYLLKSVAALVLLTISTSLIAQDSIRSVAFGYINKANRASNGDPDLGFRYLDTAQHLIVTHNLEEAGVRAGFVETSLLMRSGQIEEALVYLDSLGLVVQNPVYRQFGPRLLRFRAKLMNRMGKPAESIMLLREALDSAIVLKDTATCSVVYSNLGNRYYEYGANTQALDCFLKSLELKRALGQKSRLGYAYQGITAVHMTQNNFDMVHKYSQMAIKNFLENDLACVAVHMQGSICDAFLNDGQLDSALYYAELGLAFAKEYNCRLGLALSNFHLGNCMKEKQQYGKAKKHYLLAMEESGIITPSIFQLLNSHMVFIYLEEGHPNQALPYLDSCRAIANRVNTPYTLLQLARTELSYYKAIGNLKKALDQSEKVTKYESDNLDSEKSKTLEEMRIRFDVLQMENKHAVLTKDLQLASQENELQTQRLTIQRGFLLLVSISLVVILALFFAVVSLLKSRGRKKEIVLNEQLRRAQINPHFFFNVLNSIQAQVNRGEDRKSVVQNLANFARLMRQTLESSFHDFVQIQEEVDRLQYYVDLQHLRFNDRFEYEIVNLCKGAPAIPSQLIQPLVENAIEHGFNDKSNKGFLSIRFSYADEKRIKVEVENSCTEGEPSTPECQKIIDSAEHKSRALGIIAQRLRLFGSSKRYYYELNRGKSLTQAVIFCPFR